MPEPSCHLSFSAKSQELNEWLPCSSLFFSGYLPSLLLGSRLLHRPPLFTQWIPSFAHDFLLKADKWVSHPWESVEEGGTPPIIFSPFTLSLSLLCLEYAWYLDSLHTLLSCHWRVQQWSATGLSLINMLMVRESVRESMAMHCCGSGQVPRRKQQYKDASEHITQQSISTITQREGERVCLCVSEY